MDIEHHVNLEDFSQEKGVKEVAQWVADKWAALEGRYGRKTALAMVLAGIATLPLPGNIMAIVAAAEAIRGIRGSKAMVMSVVRKSGISNLYNRAATDPSLTYSQIDSFVDSLKSLSLTQLKEAAAEVDVFTSSGMSKDRILQEMKQSIKNRKASQSRTSYGEKSKKFSVVQSEGGWIITDSAGKKLLGPYSKLAEAEKVVEILEQSRGKSISDSLNAIESVSAHLKKGRLLNTDDEERTATFVLTTDTTDRDGETVNPEGGDFEEYKKNPVVAFNHNTDDFPIGRTLKLWNDDVGEGTGYPQAGGEKRRALLAQVQFSKANPKGDLAYQMTKEGTLTGCSISFLPQGNPEKNGNGGNHYPRWKLLEWSICPVGSNPDAIKLALKRLKRETMKLNRKLWVKGKSAWLLKAEGEEINPEIQEYLEEQGLDDIKIEDVPPPEEEEWEEAKQLPSEEVDPEKACKILQDGEIDGKPLTEEQRGMFGAACARSRSFKRFLKQVKVAKQDDEKPTEITEYEKDEEEVEKAQYAVTDAAGKVIAGPFKTEEEAKAAADKLNADVEELPPYPGKSKRLVFQDNGEWWVEAQYGEEHKPKFTSEMDAFGPFSNKQEAMQYMRDYLGFKRSLNSKGPGKRNKSDSWIISLGYGLYWGGWGDGRVHDWTKAEQFSSPQKASALLRDPYWKERYGGSMARVERVREAEEMRGLSKGLKGPAGFRALSKWIKQIEDDIQDLEQPQVLEAGKAAIKILKKAMGKAYKDLTIEGEDDKANSGPFTEEDEEDEAVGDNKKGSEPLWRRKEAWQEGQKARAAGKSEDDNPYGMGGSKANLELAYSWAMGWRGKQDFSLSLKSKRLSKAESTILKDALEFLDDAAGDGTPKRFAAGMKYHAQALRKMVEPEEDEEKELTEEETEQVEQAIAQLKNSKAQLNEELFRATGNRVI